MILEGRFGSGDRLQVQMLADLLDVSRTPVVDALGVLHTEGLLDYGAHRGYSVRQFDLENFLDAFDVRLTLEGLGARLIAERGLSEKTAKALHDNLEQTERVLFGESWSAKEREEWRALNLAFHDLLLTEANNAYLTAGVSSARMLPPMITRRDERIEQDEVWPRLARKYSQQAFFDHVRIVEAIEAGQSSRAENMMREHIFTNREKMRRILTDLEVETRKK